MSFTVAAIITACQRIYPDILDAEVVAYLNEERPELLRSLKLRRTSADILLTAETQEYTSPTALINADAFEYVRSATDGDFKVLLPTNVDALDIERPDWRRLDSAEPTWVYFIPGTAGLKVGLLPKPDQGTGVDYPLLRIRYTASETLTSVSTIYDDVPSQNLYVTRVARRFAEDQGLGDVEMRIGLATRAFDEAMAYVTGRASRNAGVRFVPSSRFRQTGTI